MIRIKAVMHHDTNLSGDWANPNSDSAIILISDLHATDLGLPKQHYVCHYMLFSCNESEMQLSLQTMLWSTNQGNGIQKASDAWKFSC